MRKVWKAGCLAMLLGAAPAAAQTPDYTIFALSHTENKVTEHEPISGKVLKEFRVPGEWIGEVHEAALSPDGKLIYVSAPYLKQVVILDAATFKQVGTIESEFFSRPEMERSFARGVKKVVTTAEPHGVALNNDGSKVYVTVEFGEVPGVVVYDVKTKRTKKIDTLVAANYLWVQPKTDKLYVPTRNDMVVVIDTKTDKILRTIPVQGAPNGVDFTPDGEAWFNGNRDASVTVVDTKTDKVIKVMKTTGKGNGRVAASPDGRFVAASQGPQVTVFDAKTKEPLSVMKTSSVQTQGFPVFSPDSNTLFVMNENSADMAVFDLKTMTEISRYPIGGASFGGGIIKKK